MSERLPIIAGPRAPLRVWRVGAFACLGLLVIAEVGLYDRIVTSNSNHVGVDIRWGWGLSAMALAWCAAGLRFRPAPRWTITVVVIAAMVFAAGLFIIDRYNVMMDYNVWIRRGMPAPWTQ